MSEIVWIVEKRGAREAMNGEWTMCSTFHGSESAAERAREWIERADRRNGLFPRDYRVRKIVYAIWHEIEDWKSYFEEEARMGLDIR